ncbi:SRPBCC family protein [Planktotalea sp.]|uniref:SRPBCC family protein n=1 Tax=Planktotalea sp. TaxID=2029877 RepID=UPI003D6AFEEB
MDDLVIERTYAVSAQQLFDAVTQSDSLAGWFGPEGVKVVDHDLSFETLGPWYADMRGSEGGKYKVSGEVLRVDAPNSVEFSWAWHNDEDVRGHESTVKFAVEDLGNGSAKLVLTHSGLADEEQCTNHNSGWSSSLNKLPKVLGL